VLLGASPFYRTPKSPIAEGLDLTEADFLRARLSAFAVETDECKRADLYTLFVVTRMLNFLKGLPVERCATLVELLDYRWHDARIQIGIELLDRLRQSHRLYFWSSKGLVENKNFKPEIFWRVLAQASEIRCQNGAAIKV
jgi:hypothetical protein